MWYYVQKSGALLRDGRPIATGYSGSGIGRNEPSREDIPDLGPIPQGRYTIGAPFEDPTCGPLAMRLTPAPSTETYGRDGFLIHGDNLAHNASHGCIVLDRQARIRIAATTDRGLIVLATLDGDAPLTA